MRQSSPLTSPRHNGFARAIVSTPPAGPHRQFERHAAHGCECLLALLRPSHVSSHLATLVHRETSVWTRVFSDPWLRAFLLFVAAAYAYGAAVHLLNMLGLSGVEWTRAPLKWTLLDIAYLIVDLCAVVGLVFRRGFGVVAFLSGAVSQIGLYTLFRAWVMDVPDAFRVSGKQLRCLNMLVLFHPLSLPIFAALALRQRNNVSSGQ